MDVNNLLNATQATEYLGLKYRQLFYDAKKEHELKPLKRIGTVWLYSIHDLKKLKKKLKPDAQ